MKMPPKAKIYEAFSAIADNRIEINGNVATVKSSDFKKEYKIKWNDKEISSTDNATFWQGYPGYPVISTWLKRNIISYDENVASYFKGINWHEINEKNKRDYDKGINELLQKLTDNNIDTEKITSEVDKIYAQIEKLDYQIVRKVN